MLDPVSRREALVGIAALAYGLANPLRSYAGHERLGKLGPEQVASLGNTPIDKLRHHILRQYLREREMYDYCGAKEGHTKKTKSDIHDECSDRWLHGALYGFRDGAFNKGNLFVKAIPIGKIETIDGKLKTDPSEPFPFAVEISYNTDGASQFWRIYDLGVKGDLSFDVNDPRVKDRFTAALSTGRGLEYFLPLNNGYRLGSLEFKDKVVQEKGGSKDATVRVISFNENTVQLVFPPAGNVHEFQFPPGIPDAYLKSHSGVTVTRERVDPKWREKHGDVYYRMGDGGGFYRKMDVKRAEGIDQKAMEFYGRARVVTKAVYHHLITHMMERGMIKP